MLLLAWVLVIVVGACGLYMMCIIVGALRFRCEEGGSEGMRFAVIIPAHDEEQGITRTVREVLAAAPRGLPFRALVIADNCSDQTAACARSAGALVLERHDLAQRGKGPALDWALRTHADQFRDSDLIAIIDADMKVDEGFFAVMARVFGRREVQVAQGRYLVANPSGSVLSAIGFASFCYVNHVRPAGRRFWGGSADLKGSGMVFRAEFLLSRGWPAHSIAEDVQLGKELAIEGIPVEYVPNARVTSEIPSTVSQVKVQQSRWEGGKRAAYAQLLPATIKAFFKAPSVLLLDSIADMLLPPLSVVILLCAAGAGVALWSASTTVWVFALSLGIFAVAVLLGLVQSGAPRGVYGRLLLAPLFVAWKVALLVRVVAGKVSGEWRRTPRDHDVKR